MKFNQRIEKAAQQVIFNSLQQPPPFPGNSQVYQPNPYLPGTMPEVPRTIQQYFTQPQNERVLDHQQWQQPIDYSTNQNYQKPLYSEVLTGRVVGPPAEIYHSQQIPLPPGPPPPIPMPPATNNYVQPTIQNQLMVTQSQVMVQQAQRPATTVTYTQDPLPRCSVTVQDLLAPGNPSDWCNQAPEMDPAVQVEAIEEFIRGNSEESSVSVEQNAQEPPYQAQPCSPVSSASAPTVGAGEPSKSRKQRKQRKPRASSVRSNESN